MLYDMSNIRLLFIRHKIYTVGSIIRGRYFLVYDLCAVEMKAKLKTDLLQICDDYVPIDISKLVFYSLAGDCPYISIT